MEILEEKELKPMAFRCCSCTSQLSLLPSDFRSDNNIDNWVHFICPVCGERNNIYVPDKKSDPYVLNVLSSNVPSSKDFLAILEDPRFHTELKHIAHGKAKVATSNKKYKGRKFTSLKNRFMRIFIRDKDIECEVTVGESTEKKFEL